MAAGVADEARVVIKGLGASIPIGGFVRISHARQKRQTSPPGTQGSTLGATLKTSAATLAMPHDVRQEVQQVPHSVKMVLPSSTSIKRDNFDKATGDTAKERWQHGK